MFSRPLFAQPDEYFFTLFRRCVIFILMATIFLAALMLFELQLPLQDDEALYWDMSRNLDLGYASKPPAIAYLIRISTTIFGHTEWAVRLPGTLLALAYLFVAYRLAYRLFHFSLAGWIVVYILLMDSQQLNNLIHITTNNLMYLFWILAIYFYWRALRRSKNGWFALGITLGLGFLSKYSMVFLLIPFLVHLTWYSPKQWRSRGIWVSLSIALVMNLGVIYWNFQLSWVSIKHTMKILENSNLESWSELLLGQILMIGPLPFVLYTIILLIMLYRRRSFPGGILLLMSSIIPILFYLYVASTRAIYPHWTYPGWIGATMGCGYYALVLNRYWPKYKHLLFSGFLVTFVLHITILIFAAVLILSGNMPHEKHPIKYKWPELWHARARYEDAPPSFIFSTSYGSAARLAYYSPGQPRVYCIEMLLQQEPNQYDVWGGWKSLVGSDAWLVEVQPAEVVLGFAAELVEGKAFSSYELMEVVEAVPARSLVEPASLPMTVVYMKNYLGKAPRQFIMERIQNSQDSENGARNMQRLAEITPKVANHLPLNLNAQKRSANVLLASGNKEKALIYLERTLSIERNPTEKLRLMEKTGLLLHDLGHDKKASAIFDVILENHSKNSVALETMGDISYEQAEYQQAAAYFTRLSTVSPEKTAKSAEYLVRIGRHWQEQENYSDAETAYSTAYRYSTDHAIALLFAGDIKREEKKYASALLYYTQFMGSEPESYEGAVRINTLIDKLGDEAQAIETWGEIAQQLPLSVLPHIYLGLAQEQKKDFENALVSFNTASKNSNTPRESHLYTATSLMLTGNINEGLLLLEKTLRSKPDLLEFSLQRIENISSLLLDVNSTNDMTRLCLLLLKFVDTDSEKFIAAKLFSNIGSDKPAENLYCQLVCDPSFTKEAARLLDSLLQKHNETEYRIHTWSKLNKEYPDIPAIEKKLANILFNTGKYEESLPLFQNLYSSGHLDPKDILRWNTSLSIIPRPKDHNNPPFSTFLESYPDMKKDAIDLITNTCHTLLKLGKSEESACLAQQLVRLTPEDEDTWLLLGKSYEQSASFEEAMNTYMEALKKANTTSKLAGQMKIILEKQDYSDHPAIWKNIVQLLPDNPTLRMHLARILEKEGLLKEAVEEYGELLKIDFELNEGRIYFGGALAKLGYCKKGIEQINLAMSKDSSLYSIAVLTCIESGEYIMKGSDFEHAIHLFQTGLQYDPNSSILRIKLAEALFRNGDFITASDIFKSILLEEQTSPIAEQVILLWNDLLIANKTPQQRVLTWREMLESIPDSSIIKEHYILSLAASGNFKKAKTYCKESRKYFPLSLICAAIDCRLGGTKESEKLFDLVFHNSNSAVPAKYIDFISTTALELIDEEKYTQAEDMLLALELLQPANLWHQVHLGEVLAAQKCYNEAIDRFINILIIAPDSAHTATQLTAIYDLLSVPDRCVADWQELVTLNPDAFIPREHLERAENIAYSRN